MCNFTGYLQLLQLVCFYNHINTFNKHTWKVSKQSLKNLQLKCIVTLPYYGFYYFKRTCSDEHVPLVLLQNHQRTAHLNKRTFMGFSIPYKQKKFQSGCQEMRRKKAWASCRRWRGLLFTKRTQDSETRSPFLPTQGQCWCQCQC